MTGRNLKLTASSGIKQRIRLFALVTISKTLEWTNPYTNEREIFPQMKSENGSRIYDLPMPYGQRLLASEPYKYFLCTPDVVTVSFAVPGGGREERNVFAKEEHVILKNKVKEVQRDESGLPKLVAKELDADETEFDD